MFTDAGAASTGALGLAGRISVNAAVDPDLGGALYQISDGIGAVAPGEAGDNTHEVALLGALTAVAAAPAASGVPGSGSLPEIVAGFSTLIATDLLVAEQTLSLRTNRQSVFVQEEAIATGVDLDIELQNLTVLQNAYAANAQVLSTIDQMYQNLLQAV